MSRILQLSITSPTLKVFGFEPSFLLDPITAILVPSATSAFEHGLNGALQSAIDTALRGTHQALAPGSVVSAQRVLVGSGGLTIAVVLANLTGAVLTALPVDVRPIVNVTPDPMGRAGQPTKYTVTVTFETTTDGTVTVHPIPGATVKLVNFAANHSTEPPQSGTTDGNGQWVSALTSLHEKAIAHSGVDVAPSVTVTQSAAPGATHFAAVTVTLDLTP